MTEEIITTTPGGETTTTNPQDTYADYIAAIEDLKANTVAKVDYDRLQQEKKGLLESLVRGGRVDTPQEAPKPVDTNKLRKELYGPECNLSNLKYWEKTLELRDAVIKETGKDPFLPFGQKIAPTAEDVQKAENVAKIVRECIDYANGDSRVFTNELNRRTVDTGPIRRRK